ncbi:RAD51-associated protein 1 isoform X1 [Arapaima gigas]
MDRPARNKKQVNYSEFQGQDDEEDFASFTGPPNKKARVSSVDSEKERKHASESLIQETGSQEAPSSKARLSVEDKLFEKNLEVALQLSMMQPTEAAEDLSSTNKCDKNENTADVQKKDHSPLLSNCSVDTSLLGLDEITDEPVSHSAPSRQRQAAAKAEKQQKRILNKENKVESGEEDNYEPDSDAGSDQDFSENDESDDEEFTVKKSTKKKANKKEPLRRPPASKKEKKPPKAVKSKAQAPAAPAASHSAAPALKKSVTASKTSRPAVPISPAGGRLPKWNPPAQVGRSPTNTRTPQVKSPGQGLRLGLSRLARVKPLHPSVAH